MGVTFLTMLAAALNGAAPARTGPRVEGAADAVAARPAHRERLTGSETILLAEDEAEVRRVVLETLESLGYRVIEAPGPITEMALSSAIRLAVTSSESGPSRRSTVTALSVT